MYMMAAIKLKCHAQHAILRPIVGMNDLALVQSEF